RIQFRYIDLSWPLERQLEQLAGFNPTVLAAPPPALDWYAAHGAHLLRPGTIYSIADVLDAEVANRVSAAFGVPVGQIYQATEGFLGISCAAGRVHLNEDVLVFEREILDPGGRFVPIITDLYRTSQAIIRYRMGDVLVPAEGDCACGSALAGVARIEGRADDVLHLPDHTGQARPLFADFIRGAVLGVPQVIDFSCVQTGHDRLRLAVLTEPGAPEAVWDQAARALQDLVRGRGLAPISLERAEFVALPVTTKRRRVRRELGH
ncbi:MAG: hypothetical protein ACOX61_05350, partial [Brooklawnia sp.]